MVTWITRETNSCLRWKTISVSKQVAREFHLSIRQVRCGPLNCSIVRSTVVLFTHECTSRIRTLRCYLQKSRLNPDNSVGGWSVHITLFWKMLLNQFILNRYNGLIWLTSHTCPITMSPAGSCGVLGRTLIRWKPTMPSILPLFVHSCVFDEPGSTLFTTNHLNGGRFLFRNPTKGSIPSPYWDSDTGVYSIRIPQSLANSMRPEFSFPERCCHRIKSKIMLLDVSSTAFWA